MVTGSDDLTEAQAIASIVVLIVMVVPLAMLLAAVIKGRYARAIVRLQTSTTVGSEHIEGVPPRAAAPGVLHVDLLRADAVPAPAGTDPARAAKALRRRVLSVQFVAGGLHWVALLICLAIGLAFRPVTADAGETGAASALAAHLTIWPLLLLLPPLLAWALQAGVRERVAWALVAAGLALLGAGAWLMKTGMAESLSLVATLAVAALTIGAFLRPAIRGAGPPLIVAFSVSVLVVGALMLVVVAIDTSSDDEPVSALELAAAVLAIAVFFAAGAACAWRMLIRLARRYEARRFSDLQLAFGAYWGLVTLFMIGLAMLFAFEEKAGAVSEWIALMMLVVWAVWRVVLRLAMRWAVRRAAPVLPPLLLLRVFKPSNRSEAFSDRFLARWRFFAPTWMIAGPDLAGAFMEPDEFFAFVSRRLAARFVRDRASMQARLEALAATRDPDGRLRVDEVFCSNTMWKPTVLALIERAGVVLLDLREYSEQRAGTRYELHELLRRAAFDRLIVLTDEAGDAPRLRASIDAAWREVGGARDGRLKVLRVERASDTEMEGLVRAVSVVAAAGRASIAE